MSIIRTKKSSHTPYVLLDTTAMNDARLSFRAKGLHAYLMSKPDGWQVHIKHLEHVSKEGRDAISVALTELAQAGYLHRERVRGEDGRLAGWQTTIYETPQPRPDEPDQHGSDPARQRTPSSPTTDFPTSVSPSSVLPSSVNPHLVSIDSREKALNENSPLTPMNGGTRNVDPQNRGTNTEFVGEHTVCSRGDSPTGTPAPSFPAPGARAEGTNPRALGTDLRTQDISPRQSAEREAAGAREKAQAAMAACAHCDAKGKLLFFDAESRGFVADCPHDLPKILAYVASHAYTWPAAPCTAQGEAHAPWTHHEPDGPPHGAGTADAAGLAADDHPSGRAGPAGTDHAPAGGGPDDHPDGPHGRDLAPVCLHMGRAVAGAGPGGVGGPAPPRPLAHPAPGTTLTPPGADEGGPAP